nr:MAG TPA: hypothetical protein [Crassvirales sp.]
MFFVRTLLFDHLYRNNLCRLQIEQLLQHHIYFQCN